MFDAGQEELETMRQEILETARKAIRRLGILRAELARDGLRDKCASIDEAITELRMCGRGKL